jgi:hypothetical protein
MSGKYQVRLEPGARLEQRATHFARSGTIALILMAALPAALGLLQHATFVASTRVPEIGGQNAAAPARALGNQPSHSTLENGGKGMLGAKGEVLALCSGVARAKPVVHLNCATLSSTIQR